MTIRTPDMSPQDWDTAAEAYDCVWTPFLGQCAGCVRLASVKRGDRVLDVAAGPGTLTLVVAGLGTKVVATDFSPVMARRYPLGMAALLGG